MFKYYNNKSSSLANRRYNRYNDSNSSNISFHPRRRIHQGFFIKPYLKITGLVSHTQKITLYTTEKRQEYDAKIWTLSVKNKHPRISKNVKSCVGNVYFDVLQVELPLKWKASREKYLHHNFPVNEKELRSKEDAFLGNLGFYTTASLYRFGGIDSIDIPVNENGELYFLITFPDLPVAFLVLDSEEYSELHEYENIKMRISQWNGVNLILEFKTEYNFNIRFEGQDYYEEKGRSYKIKINSWDNIELK